MANLLSVVIPVRDQAACLAWTLEALTRQTDLAGTFEVVLVDDASGDGSGDVAAGFADRLDLTVVRNETNQGRSAARNRGAAAAHGDHLLFLDADSRVPQNLVGGHQRWRQRSPEAVVMGRRIEMGWWTMARLRAGAELESPLPFEGDERDTRGMSDTERDYFATSPWLFAATHNLSLKAETFHQLGGFDEAMAGWGYEDNEFLYRAARWFGKAEDRFRYDPGLVCYHMPHFRDWTAEWDNTRSALAHIKDRHRHYEVELLSHPPNHLRISQTLPYYSRCLDHLRATSDHAAARSAVQLMPETAGPALWIGCGIHRPAGAVTFDHARPHTRDNPHLLGVALPYGTGELTAVVNLDVWRFLTPVDLSAVVMEGLRVAPDLYLALSKNVTDEPEHRLGFVDDLDYVTAMFAPRYRVDRWHDDDEIAVLRLR